MRLPENFNFSQSNLQDYLDCHYRFYLRYIRHMKWPALVVDDAADFEQRGQTGARFHRLLQQYLLGLPEDRLSDLAAADPAKEVLMWWQDFLHHVPPWLSDRLSVETTLSTTLAGHRLIAKYDLILVQEDGQLAVFDWKTSQKRPRKDWLLERVQTRLYRLILTQAGSNFTGQNAVAPETVTMNYWFAPQPESLVSLPYTQDVYENDVHFFTGLIEEIVKRDEDHFLKTNHLKKCRYCVYRSHCDRGIGAGELDAFEDFQLETADLDEEIKFSEIPQIEF